jgi:hypothetical protein
MGYLRKDVQYWVECLNKSKTLKGLNGRDLCSEMDGTVEMVK